MDNKDKKSESSNDKKSAGQVLPDVKKHLIDKMSDAVKSPMHGLKDKSDIGLKK